MEQNDNGLEIMTTGVSTMLSPEVILEQKKKITALMAKNFVPGVHFGTIPGAGKKPVLFKAGAEYLAFAFNLRPHTEMTPVYTPDGHLTCSVRVMVHASDGTYLGDGYGVCSTRETKYALKRADLVCPDCGKAALRRSKPEYGGGWYCATNSGGCNAKFKKDDARMTQQDATTATNPADFYNTVTKMGHKRALVAAMLVTTAASAFFTQDLEDGAYSGPDFLEAEQCEAIARELETVGGDIGKMLAALAVSNIYELREVHLPTITQVIDGHKRRKGMGR